MKHITAVAYAIGIEGAFLIAGVALMTAAASYISPAAALAVVGLSCVLAGIALALPRRG